MKNYKKYIKNKKTFFYGIKNNKNELKNFNDQLEMTKINKQWEFEKDFIGEIRFYTILSDTKYKIFIEFNIISYFSLIKNSQSQKSVYLIVSPFSSKRSGSPPIWRRTALYP